MRPLEQPEETQDLTFIEEDTYKVILNWGIYADHEATTPERFYGHRNDRGLLLPDEDKPLQPRDMKISVASFAKKLIPSAFVLFLMTAVFE
jgi:hypothetical protein